MFMLKTRRDGMSVIAVIDVVFNNGIVRNDLDESARSVLIAVNLINRVLANSGKFSASWLVEGWWREMDKESQPRPCMCRVPIVI